MGETDYGTKISAKMIYDIFEKARAKAIVSEVAEKSGHTSKPPETKSGKIRCPFAIRAFIPNENNIKVFKKLDKVSSYFQFEKVSPTSDLHKLNGEA